MRAAIHSLAIALFAAAALHAARVQAEAAATQPPGLAILDLDYVDTSGEPTDQTAAHQRRAAAFVASLKRDLGGRYRIVPIVCGAEPCASLTNPVELQEAARTAGAKFVLLGGVHKMSTLIQWAKIQIVDEDAGRIVFDRLITFRGDTDEAWQRAESFIAGEVLHSAPGLGK